MELRAARDATIPGDKKANALAEITNGIIQEGCRAVLMTAGLPMQFWVYACSYFCRCYNTQQRPGGDSLWKKEIWRGLRWRKDTAWSSDLVYPAEAIEAQGVETRRAHPRWYLSEVHAPRWRTRWPGELLPVLGRAGGLDYEDR